MHRHSRFALIAVIILIACSTGRWSLAQDSEANPAEIDETAALETVRIQLKWFHQFQFAGYYAAIENGFYEADVNGG